MSFVTDSGILLGKQIASIGTRISSLFFISFPAAVSNPLPLFRASWIWAVAKAYGLLVYMVIVLFFTKQVLGSKLKAQLPELRFPCSNTVPRSPLLLCISDPTLYITAPICGITSSCVTNGPSVRSGLIDWIRPVTSRRLCRGPRGSSSAGDWQGGKLSSCGTKRRVDPEADVGILGHTGVPCILGCPLKRASKGVCICQKLLVF